MATTTPWNIYSPDSGSPYSLTANLGTMAASVNTALVTSANYGVGTTTQMNAALSKFPNGALWYNTTTSSEWRRVSGAWVNLAPVRTNLTPASGYTFAYPANFVETKDGWGDVFASVLAGGLPTYSLSNYYTVATLPVGSRPGAYSYYATVAGSSPAQTAMRIQPAGEIQVACSQPSAASISLNCRFPLA